MVSANREQVPSSFYFLPNPAVKNALLSHLVERERRRIQQLLGAEQLDDRRPTQLFPHLQTLLGDKAASLNAAIFRELVVYFRRSLLGDSK